MNFDSRRCTQSGNFEIPTHTIPPNAELSITCHKVWQSSFSFHRDTLKSNVESLISVMSMYTLNVKCRKNIKTKGNQKYTNKTYRAHSNWRSGDSFQRSSIFHSCNRFTGHLERNWSSTQQNASQIWDILAVRGIFFMVTSPALHKPAQFHLSLSNSETLQG